MDLTEKEQKLILALCRNDLNQVAAGKELYYHPNTVRYHAKCIQQKTGEDPLTFMGAMNLLMRIRLDEGAQ